MIFQFFSRSRFVRRDAFPLWRAIESRWYDESFHLSFSSLLLEGAMSKLRQRANCGKDSGHKSNYVWQLGVVHNCVSPPKQSRSENPVFWGRGVGSKLDILVI